MAVYTDVAADELADFLSRYDIGELLSYKGIAEGVENSNFLLHTSAGYFILTLYEKRVAKGDLPFFLGLMTHLASRGISCPLPFKNRSGEALSVLAGEFARRRDSRRSVSRQRFLSRRAALRHHRFHLCLQRHARLRRRDLPQRLVLRERLFVQCHQGARIPQCLRPGTQAVTS